MARLESCWACEGFVPFEARACPHCGKHRYRLARRALGLTAGGAVAVTLMACYGGPETGRGGPPSPVSASAEALVPSATAKPTPSSDPAPTGSAPAGSAAPSK